ncbi:MAG: ATP-binding cassette domain-containing protein, partial [Oligoflexia bacterium]|nr:ATP-binding cassette domain-containing protein [Oligoflexia bacterium]
MLELKNITKKYTMGDNKVYALNDVSFKIDRGDFVAIMGPSGSGKSTLMNIIGLLDTPTRGEYFFNNRKVSNFDEDSLSILRRKIIGFVFQQFNLLPRMPALDNVALPTLYSEKSLNFFNARQILSKVGLAERAAHRPNELSGGQQQRVAIARALINSPAIILADEPTGNLDSKSEEEIITLLKDLNKSGITVIMVTHEEEIARHARRMIKMRDGRIQSDERLDNFTKGAENNLTAPEQKSDTALRIKYLVKYFELGIKTLLANKVRTFLSMLGIMIGVAAVVAMLALGTGAQKAIEKELASLGSNMLMLRAGAMRGPGGARAESGATTRLTLEDATAIKNQVPYINNTSPVVNGSVQAVFANKNWNTRVTGVLPAYAGM